MKRIVGTGVCLVLLAAVGACASNKEDPGLLPASGTEGFSVKAQQDVIVSATPLGDVVNGTLKKGQSATAVCFVRQATTNAGSSGGAIKVEVGDLSGYAAVADFPKDPSDRQMVFDMDEGSLQDRLPSCSE